MRVAAVDLAVLYPCFGGPLPALYGHERAAEDALAVVHEDPPDDSTLASLEPARAGSQPVLSLAGHGASSHPKLARLGVHHGAIRKQQLPVELPVGAIHSIGRHAATANGRTGPWG
jgi:hypothetical protein